MAAALYGKYEYNSFALKNFFTTVIATGTFQVLLAILSFRWNLSLRWERDLMLPVIFVGWRLSANGR